ncbi:MAG TPA: zinc ribbon domain-containing protein [Gemmatimonadota bacterium]|nr:zinc ribbon domain-containing protein [Gemmatimonadota bacterium]
MPTYVYQCPECEHEFEIFAKMSDRRRARKCPACGARATRVITGGAGFLFKGEGFYITDYRSEEYRSKEKAEKEPVKEKAPEVPAGDASADKKEASPEGEKPDKAGAGNGNRPARKDGKSGRKGRPGGRPRGSGG